MKNEIEKRSFSIGVLFLGFFVLALVLLMLLLWAQSQSVADILKGFSYATLAVYTCAVCFLAVVKR